MEDSGGPSIPALPLGPRVTINLLGFSSASEGTALKCIREEGKWARDVTGRRWK